MRCRLAAAGLQLWRTCSSNLGLGAGIHFHNIHRPVDGRDCVRPTFRWRWVSQLALLTLTASSIVPCGQVQLVRQIQGAGSRPELWVQGPTFGHPGWAESTALCGLGLQVCSALVHTAIYNLSGVHSRGLSMHMLCHCIGLCTYIAAQCEPSPHRCMPVAHSMRACLTLSWAAVL